MIGIHAGGAHFQTWHLNLRVANRLQEVENKSKVDAAAEAAKQKLRPIIMTASTMALGVVPLAIATGPGAVGRQSIGWSVIGGLVFGTVLTYSFCRLHAILGRQDGRRSGEIVTPACISYACWNASFAGSKSNSVPPLSKCWMKTSPSAR